MFLLIITFVVCCWKRRQNILRVQNAGKNVVDEFVYLKVIPLFYFFFFELGITSRYA